MKQVGVNAGEVGVQERLWSVFGDASNLVESFHAGIRQHGHHDVVVRPWYPTRSEKNA